MSIDHGSLDASIAEYANEFIKKSASVYVTSGLESARKVRHFENYVLHFRKNIDSSIVFASCIHVIRSLVVGVRGVVCVEHVNIAMIASQTLVWLVKKREINLNAVNISNTAINIVAVTIADIQADGLQVYLKPVLTQLYISLSVIFLMEYCQLVQSSNCLPVLETLKELNLSTLVQENIVYYIPEIFSELCLGKLCVHYSPEQLIACGLTVLHPQNFVQLICITEPDLNHQIANKIMKISIQWIEGIDLFRLNCNDSFPNICICFLREDVGILAWIKNYLYTLMRNNSSTSMGVNDGHVECLQTCVEIISALAKSFELHHNDDKKAKTGDGYTCK